MWPAFPAPDYYKTSAPPDARQPATGLSPPALAAREQGTGTGGSRVHCMPIGEGGAQLLSRQPRHDYAAGLHRGLRTRRYLPDAKSAAALSTATVHCTPAPIRQI
jgi:hypothetical protein